MPDGGHAPQRRGGRTKLSSAQRRERLRLAVAVLIGALVTAFALLNIDKVKVHWIIASGRTPLIVVIAASFLLGIAADRIAIFRRGRGGR
jgi:uncharacterized integral membrane protein